MKLNKLLAGLGATILTAALAITVSAADPVVVWDFANADDTTLYNEDGTVAFSTNGVTATYDAENACLTADVLNGDPYLQLPDLGDFPAENRFVRVKYYQSGISDWSTSIYFTTDTVAWSETGHWKGFYDGDDDEWCEQTFYMDECPAWAGTITAMRLDVFDSAYEGQLAKVAYVAVFGSEEDANNFDYAAWRAAGSPVSLAAPAADAAAEETAAPGIGEAYPASGTAVPDGSVLIAGELIGSEMGWGGAAAAGRHAAFDGNIETFFDPATASVDYCGIDAGEEMILTKIIIHPRTTYLDRFNGATIEASNDPDFAESVELFFSVEQAAEVAYIDVTEEMEADANTGYRYFRYINYMSHGDVAEVELYGYAKDGSNPDYSAGAAAPAADGPALPSTEYDSIANYAGIKPVIDGKIDAIWSATAAQESTWPGDLNGEGISGYTKILWDEDNLYFLGVVNDPTTLQAANPTTTDSIDFWVSETYSDEMGYPLEGDYQLALSPYNTYGGNKAPDLVNETGAVINGDGTYVVEFSIPWQTQGLTPAAGHVFGYNASFNNDLDGDGKRDSWTSWVEWSGMPYWSDTMWLGQVELVKADVAVAVDEAPAAEAPAAAVEVIEIDAAASVQDYPNMDLLANSGAGYATLEEATASIGKTAISGYTFVSGTGSHANEGPENLWDNDTATKFCAPSDQFPTISIVALDGEYTIDGIVMATANDNSSYNGRSPYEWAIYGSKDGSAWTAIAYGDDYFFEETDFTYYAGAVNATDSFKYIMFQSEGGLSGTFQVSEVAVCGTKVASAAPAVEEAPAAEPTIFANATLVEVSGLEVEGSNTGDMAFDGDMATRWSSNTSDAAHIIVDLGAVTPVDSLDIYWETACAADYTVEVSEDNANWTVVATVTDNATGASPVGEAV
ncbi:MAG: discoidin domain-containing protein, partial [Clostridia bacterium]|nr:discoidin domain-containing protein [Clostridia bacterium]